MRRKEKFERSCDWAGWRDESELSGFMCRVQRGFPFKAKTHKVIQSGDDDG